MADFSKQWCEINDPQMPGDFDIYEVASDLDSGYATGIICEGFGFIAIGKDLDGNIMLAIPTGNHSEKGSEVDWKPLEEVING